MIERREGRSALAFLAAFLLATGASAADAAHPDLATCLSLARGTAPRLAAARAEQDEAAARAGEAAARRLPVLGLGGAYRYTSKTMTATLSLSPSLPSRTLTFGDGNVYDLNLGLKVPLFTGGELSHAARAAAAGRRASELRTEATALDLDRDVRSAYYAALGAGARVAAADLAVARLRRHLEEVEGAVTAGAATEEARLRAASRLSEALENRVKAGAARDSAGVALGRLIGRPQEPVTPAGDLSQSLLDGRDLPEAGAERRPELLALQEEQNSQELTATAAGGRLWPRVVGEVAGHYGRPGVDQISNEWMSYAVAGVSLDWPLWDGGARSKRVRQARARARMIEALRRDATEAEDAGLATIRTRLDAAREERDRVAERADLAHRILKLVGDRYAQADATENEYLDAQDDVSRADIELALARTRVRLAEATLLRALGL